MKRKILKTIEVLFFVLIVVILAIGASENGKRINKINLKEINKL